MDFYETVLRPVVTIDVSMYTLTFYLPLIHVRFACSCYCQFFNGVNFFLDTFYVIVSLLLVFSKKYRKYFKQFVRDPHFVHSARARTIVLMRLWHILSNGATADFKEDVGARRWLL